MLCVVPATMVVNRLLLITTLQMSHRRSETEREAFSAIFGPCHRPHKRLSPLCLPFSVPLISGPPQQMKKALWGGPPSLDPLLYLLAWCEQLPVLVSVIHTNIHTHSVWFWRPLGRFSVSYELWQTLLCSLSHYFSTCCQSRSPCFPRAWVIWLSSVWTAVMSIQH